MCDAIRWFKCKLKHLKNCRIIIFCDNKAVVDMVNNLTSFCGNCMYLIQLLVLSGLNDNCRIFVRHVKTFLNKQADFLSRLKLEAFFKCSPNSMHFQKIDYVKSKNFSSINYQLNLQEGRRSAEGIHLLALIQQ